MSSTTAAARSRWVSWSSLLWASAGALLLALSAQVRFVIPGTPVPVTFQTYTVLVLGGLLGSRLGVSATVLYLFLGLVGLPWFAAVAIGPTLGYLVGFIAAAYWVGRDTERSVFLQMISGQAIIYLFGVSVLSFFVGPKNAVAAGIAPFFVSDILKVVAASLTVKLLKKVKAT